MKLRGLLIIVAAITIPLLWFIPLAASHENSEAIYSQYLGSVSLILIGIAQLLATRIKGIEALFGPMDQVYVLHKWVGMGAIIAAFYHSLIEPLVKGGVTLLPKLAETAALVGEVAFFGLMFLVILSLITIIPYYV